MILIKYLDLPFDNHKILSHLSPGSNGGGVYFFYLILNRT